LSKEGHAVEARGPEVLLITLVSLSAAVALVATFFGSGAAFRRLGGL